MAELIKNLKYYRKALWGGILAWNFIFVPISYIDNFIEPVVVHTAYKFVDFLLDLFCMNMVFPGAILAFVGIVFLHYKVQDWRNK